MNGESVGYDRRIVAEVLMIDFHVIVSLSINKFKLHRVDFWLDNRSCG
jgi:hypothetical protein